MSSRIFDALVIGGGPAGTIASSILARRGKDVVVCERNVSFGRKTGDCLSAESANFLRRLSMGHALTGHTLTPGISVAWGDERITDRNYLFEPFGEGYLLDRSLFDAALSKKCIDFGTNWLAGVTFLAAKYSNRLWLVTFKDQSGTKFTLVARSVIDAGGRASRFSLRSGGMKQEISQLVAIAGQFDYSFDKKRGWSSIESVNDGWWYFSQLPNQACQAIKFTDISSLQRSKRDRESGVDFKKRFIEQVADIKSLRRMNLSGKSLKNLSVCDASSTRVIVPSDKLTNWLPIGDAAMCFDPITTNGLSFAISSAYYGANAVLDMLKGETGANEAYMFTIHKHFEETIEATRNVYQREQRWPESRFWQLKSKEHSTASLKVNKAHKN